mgnify:FL=1
MAIHEEDVGPDACISSIHNRQMKSTVLYREFLMGIAIAVHAHVNHCEQLQAQIMHN